MFLYFIHSSESPSFSCPEYSSSLLSPSSGSSESSFCKLSHSPQQLHASVQGSSTCLQLHRFEQPFLHPQTVNSVMLDGTPEIESKLGQRMSSSSFIPSISNRERYLYPIHFQQKKVIEEYLVHASKCKLDNYTSLHEYLHLHSLEVT